MHSAWWLSIFAFVRICAYGHTLQSRVLDKLPAKYTPAENYGHERYWIELWRSKLSQAVKKTLMDSVEVLNVIP